MSRYPNPATGFGAVLAKPTPTANVIKSANGNTAAFESSLAEELTSLTNLTEQNETPTTETRFFGYAHQLLICRVASNMFGRSSSED